MTLKVFTKYIVIFLCTNLFSACAKSDAAVIQIRPDLYKYGVIESESATPIVEAALKTGVNKIRLIACPDTPPKKIISFKRELDAKIKAELELEISQERCISQS